MIQRKKSLRDYIRDKRIREGKPLYAVSPLQPLKPKSATGRPSGAQDANQPVKRPRATLKRESPKRAKENRQYTEQRKAFLVAHPFCQIRTTHCTHHATDIHHRAGRLGAMLLDESQWLSTCRNCHQWTHQHSNAARELGFIAPRGA